DTTHDGKADLKIDLSNVATLTATDILGVNVDTVAPTVTGVSLSDTLINEADAGHTVTPIITFSEAMNQTSTPIVTTNAGSTLTGASGIWFDATHYKVSYTIVDA